MLTNCNYRAWFRVMSKATKLELHGVDPSSRFGAWTLAEFITDVWRRRGFGNVEVERYEVSPGYWGLRSNLVRGLPPARLR